MSAPAYALIVAVLATWRVTHLLHAEDGPADLLVKLRRAAGTGFFGSLLDCFYCLSLWVSVPFALVTGSTWLERGMLWLALSGGACLLERLQPSSPAALYVEDKEETDVLLRQQTSDGLATTEPFPDTPPSSPAASAPASSDAADVGSGVRSEPGEGGAP